MKKINRICSIICLTLVLCMFSGNGRVSAETNDHLTGTVTVLRQETDCLLQVQVKNTGADFEGTVRLVFSGTTDEEGCAFDQWMVLPKGGEKQYTLTVPSIDVGRTRGNGVLAFVDQKGTVLASSTFTNLFGDKNRGINVGVLSDHFDRLGWMSMSGQTYYLHGTDQNIYLSQLDAATLQTKLDQLYFLVIDDFDVSTLGKDNIQAIEQWVNDGGWLLIGTGARVKDTLGGFDPDFTQVSYGSVSEPGEENSVQKARQSRQIYYGFENIDFTQMAVAELQSGNTNAYDSEVYPGWVNQYGDGAIGVCAISFGDKQMQNASSDLCYSIYDQVASYSNSISQYLDDDDSGWSGRRAFGKIDHENTSLDFSWLKGLIVIYVIGVGPVVYLILRKMKKRDWYWIAVPVLGVCFIGVVFFFGRGLKLHETRAYSVTVQQADEKSNGKISTYYSAYHSGVKPWSVKLGENYSYAGSGFSEYYSGGSGKADPAKYHYQITYDNGVSAGARPQANFENEYLFAAGTAEGCGKIETKDLCLTQTTQEGTVTNHTTYDFPYLLLVSDDYVMVFSDVKAGETINLDTDRKKAVVTQPVSYVDDISNLLVEGYTGNADVTYEHPDLAAALSIGVSQIRRQNDVTGSVIVEGVTQQYPKTIKSKCSEMAFGCLYTLAAQEVSNASN